MIFIILDSISELDHYPLNPSNMTLNDTLRNILEKKQETAKKTFDLFSEKKSNIKTNSIAKSGCFYLLNLFLLKYFL